MSRRFRMIALAPLLALVFGALALGSGTARAEGVEHKTAAAPNFAASGGRPQTSPANGPTPTSAPLPPPTGAELALQGQAIVQRGTQLSQNVGRMLNDATREGDIIRVKCLNDTLTQINANLSNAQSRLSALQSTVDSSQRNHEYTVLTVLGQKFQDLDQQANQCVGQDLYQTGSTKVVTVIDKSQMPFGGSPSLVLVNLPPGNQAGAGAIPAPPSGTK